MLLLLRPLNDFFLFKDVGGGPCDVNRSGTGSRMKSGRLNSAFGSSICIFSCIPSGTPSRINSGRESIASGSFVRFFGRTASCACNRPASEWRASRVTKASR